MYKKIKVILFLYVFLKCIFLAISIKFGIPPDEYFHFTFSTLINEQGLPVYEDENTYYLGSLNTIPYLYHLLMSLFVKVSVFDIEPYVFLRILNLVVYLLYIYYSFKLIDLLLKNDLSKTLVVVILTNTLMLNFLGSSISYDNLANLASLLMIYSFFKYIYFKEYKELENLILFSLIGASIKITIIPLFLILLFIISLDFLFKKYTLKFNFNILSCFKYFSMFIILFMVLTLYYDNYSKYNSFIPSASKVFGSKVALSNIENHRLYNEFRLTKESRRKINFIYYVPKHFIQLNKTIYGVAAHKHFFNKLYILIIVLFIISFISFIRFKNVDIVSTYTILIFILYYSTLMFYNYNSYLSTHVFTAGLQGRYLFPVYILYLSFISKVLEIRIFKKYSKIILIILITIQVLFSFPHFLFNFKSLGF